MSQPQTQEIEAKLLVRDLQRIVQQLNILGAERITPRQMEHNLRLDHPDRSLTRTGKVLRLRAFDDVRLTYKEDKRASQGISTRTELEVTVGDFEQTLSILAALGYEVIFMYEKYRTVYQLEECAIMLDEMPYGHFVEIEAPDGEKIKSLAKRLGLTFENAIADSYHVLFLNIKKSLGLDFKDISFENFKAITVQPADMNATPAD